MNRWLPWLLFFLAIPPRSATAADGRLVVHFTGLSDDRGQVAAALWDSRAQAPRLRYAGPIADGGSTRVVVEGLAFGRYVISANHDANGNGDLDSGLFGIPREDYGFSINARGGFGPPDYEAAAFGFSHFGQILELRIE